MLVTAGKCKDPLPFVRRYLGSVPRGTLPRPVSDTGNNVPRGTRQGRFRGDQNRGSANCRLKRRGKRSGQVPVERIALYPAPPCRHPPMSAMPSLSSASGTQRFHAPESSPGGSLTTRTPSGARRGAAHSAVGPGAAKDRAVTRPALPRSSPRATETASMAWTSTRSAMPNSRTAHRRNVHRRSPRSTRIHRFDVRVARTRPGTPPPVPRSTAIVSESRSTGSPAVRAGPEATLGSPGPPKRRKPALCAGPSAAARGVRNPSATAASRISPTGVVTRWSQP